MTVTVPDDLVDAFMLSDRDPAEAALRAMALEAYRERRITAYRLRTLLGIASRFELAAFLKDHRVEMYTAEDFEHDLADLDTTAPPA